MTVQLIIQTNANLFQSALNERLKKISDEQHIIRRIVYSTCSNLDRDGNENVHYTAFIELE